jgi:FAD/FMN-containing dehydrogenase
MAPADWRRLLLLAHTDKSRAFAEYAAFYRRSHGQVYACDRHQFGVYLDGYHGEIDRRVGHCGSEMITELFVPRPRLAELLAACADDFRHHGVEPIYGTVRLVRADRESFLAWACEDFACVVFNLHVRHDAAGHAHAAAAFQRLIDLALQRGGSYYLTYHRHARRDQLLRAYPQLPAFLRAKRRFDPELIFASDWYRQHCAPLESCSAR